MAQQTLLNMVQNILSAMSSDEVNSIYDTVEATQVAQIIENKYYDIMARGDLALDLQLFQLNPSDNASFPVSMLLPVGVSRIDWLKYYNTNPLDNSQNSQFGSFRHDLNTDITTNNASGPTVPPGYAYVQIVPIDYFLEITDRLDLTQNNVKSYQFKQSGNTYTFKYFTDRQPRMCTVISNQFVVFDSFDNTQDSTLQASKTEAYGQILPVFNLQDNFVPVLDDLQFPLLLNESKSLAFYELKQMAHQKADQEVQRQWTVTQKTKSKANKPSYFDQLDNYARVPRTGMASGYPVWRWMRYGM
jgi:hypothetical protein